MRRTRNLSKSIPGKASFPTPSQSPRNPRKGTRVPTKLFPPHFTPKTGLARRTDSISTATQERSFGNVTCGTFVPACRVQSPGTVHTHPTGRNYPPHPVVMHPGHPGKPLISHLWVLQPQAHPTSPAAMESLEWVFTLPVHTTQPPPHSHPALPGGGTQL